jgi:DNA-binding PadR family transcriptional regulator
MALDALASRGSLDGYAITARLEQASDAAPQLNPGALDPGLMRLEQWGVTSITHAILNDRVPVARP